MKLLYLFVLCGCIFSGHAQNAKITIGRGTNCFGRGACSIEFVDNSNSQKKFNAVFSSTNNKLILRVLRNKLSLDESTRILGQTVTAANMNSLQFVMDEPIELPFALQQSLLKTSGKRLNQLKKGTYVTNISEEIIEIILLKS